jgi:hypothetical protein
MGKRIFTRDIAPKEEWLCQDLTNIGYVTEMVDQFYWVHKFNLIHLWNIITYRNVLTLFKR